MKYKITRIHIHHYRSISDLVIDLPTNEEPTVICGPNNVGKTNILRALNLFFHENYIPEDDVPYHIAEGSRGQGFKSVIEVSFWHESSKTRWTIKKDFTPQKKTIKKEYKLLTITSTIKKKLQQGYLKNNILKFITNEVTEQNPELEQIDFESDSIKKWLCKLTCLHLTRERCLANNKKYPKVLEFLNEMVNNGL